MLKKFASLAHDKEYAYSYDSQAFDMKAPVNEHFRMFYTYGDGLCQHSHDWPITSEYLADYLASLATIMMDDPELTDKVRYTLWNQPSPKEIEFAASIVWKEGQKTKYFSAKELKVSSSDSKRHDKRYEEIRDIHDGTPNSIFRILTPEYADGMQRYIYATTIRNWCLAADGRPWMELPAFFINWTKDRDEARKIMDAYEAARGLVESYQARCSAQSHLENYKRSLPKAQEQTDAA
jgi:hypothetical protein